MHNQGFVHGFLKCDILLMQCTSADLGKFMLEVSGLGIARLQEGVRAVIQHVSPYFAAPEP